jgi:fibronectin-binding autotransporter adhesin
MMKRYLKILATGIFLALSWIGAHAQQVNPYCTQSTAPPYVWAPCNPSNALAVTASVSASISGFPTIQSTGTPLAVTSVSGTAALPSGAVVVASNVGATNGAYCKLGASATTSDQLIPPNSWFAFTVGANTQLSCITSTSTTTVNLVGGSGLPTGSGGGGGGSGGGGVVTQPTASLLNATVVGTGTFATQAAQSGTWNITNVSGTVSLPTGASTSALQPTNAAQGSTTSGQTGYLVEGAVTTGSPTYTTAQTSPLSLDTTGALRVNVTAGGAGGGAVTVASGADVVEGTITTAHGCSVAGYTVIGCLGQIDDDVKGSIPAGTNSIGTTQLPANVTATDCSGTVVTGGTAVNAFTAQTTLHGFTIVNTNTSEVMWISFTTTAAASTAGSYPIPAATATTFAGGGSFTSPPGFGLNHALSVVAATSAHPYSCTWW